ncbi:MAG: hypothetical protein JXQ97_04785 [Natronospirillum sp.]
MSKQLFAIAVAALLSVTLTTTATTNPHLSMVPTDGIFHYQARISELTSTELSSAGLRSYSDMLPEDDGTTDYAVAVRLLQDVLQTMAEGPSGGDQLGLDQDGWATLYHVGSTFMLRMDITNPAPMTAWMKDLAARQNLTPQRLPSTEGELYRVAQGDAFDQTSTYLWLGERQATLAVSSDRVAATALQQRLRGVAVTPSLASQGTAATLANELQVSTSQLGWLHIENLTRSLVSTAPSLLAQELDLTTPDYTPQQAAACETEWLELAQQSPRIVFGQTHTTSSAGTVDSTSKVLWEVKNASVQQQIGRLQGTLPTDQADIDRTQFSVGLGLNVDAIAPVLMMWWQSLTQRQWACPTLDEMKQELAQSNPATIAIAAAVMQGAQSAVLDIFASGDANGDLAGLDALMAVRSRDPFLLSAILTQSVPFLSGVVVPATGEPVSLPLPFPGLKLQARITGDYLAVYQGAQATARAAVLKDIPHSPAFLRFSLDALQAMDTLNSGLTDLLPRDSLNRESCDQFYAAADLMAEFDIARGGVELATNPQGVSMRQQNRVRLRAAQSTAAASGPTAGQYDLAILWDDCSWQNIGTDTLNADGSALYSELDTVQGQACSVSETRYQWQLSDRTLVWANSESRYRDGCNDSFSAWEDDGADIQCKVVRTSADGSFDCIANFELPERFRYTPRREN